MMIIMEPYIASVMSNVALASILSLPVLAGAFMISGYNDMRNTIRHSAYNRETDRMLNEALRTRPLSDDARLQVY